MTGHAVDIFGREMMLDRESWESWMEADGASPAEINAGPGTPHNRNRMRSWVISADSFGGTAVGGTAVDNCDYDIGVLGGFSGGNPYASGPRRCPAARSGAAAWRGNTGGWIFGGTAAAAGSGWNRTAASRGLMQTMILQPHAPDGSIGLGGSIVMHDLWHFNGDAQKPRWRQIRCPVGATPGSPLWPPGVLTADGAWTDAKLNAAGPLGEVMVLMLLIGEPGRPAGADGLEEQCDQFGCDGTGNDACCAATDGRAVVVGKGGPGRAAVGCKDGYELAHDLTLTPDQGSHQGCPTGSEPICCVVPGKIALWAFSLDTELWSELGVAGDGSDTNGWPRARTAPLAADGFLLAGRGDCGSDRVESSSPRAGRSSADLGSECSSDFTELWNFGESNVNPVGGMGFMVDPSSSRTRPST